MRLWTQLITNSEFLHVYCWSFLVWPLYRSITSVSCCTAWIAAVSEPIGSYPILLSGRVLSGVGEASLVSLIPPLILNNLTGSAVGTTDQLVSFQVKPQYRQRSYSVLQFFCWTQNFDFLRLPWKTKLWFYTHVSVAPHYPQAFGWAFTAPLYPLGRLLVISMVDIWPRLI